MSSTWSIEIETAVPAPRLFKAAVMDWNKLAPKIAADKILSVVLVEGDGSSIGSVWQFNFAPGLPFSFVKERLDSLDVEKYEAKSTLIEGGGLGIRVESATTHVKIEPKAAGGSVCKVTGSYKPLPGVDSTEETEKAKAMIGGVFKGCEAYLVANPDAYN